MNEELKKLASDFFDACVKADVPVFLMVGTGGSSQATMVSGQGSQLVELLANGMLSEPIYLPIVTGAVTETLSYLQNNNHITPPEMGTKGKRAKTEEPESTDKPSVEDFFKDLFNGKNT